MAFENNQQDAFNLRNDTESLKQWQSELDKATTSIGAAEVAAEEELAVLKLKNLGELQKARLRQLDQLIAQEEAGVRELAALRLKLSERQFEVRKKEIQKELQLAKAAADELRKAQSSKAKKSESFTKKQDTISGIKTSSKGKPANTAENTLDNASVKKVKVAEHKEKEFSNDKNGLKAFDIGSHSFESILEGFDNLRNSLSGKDNAQTRKDLNSVIKSEKPVSQTSIDAAGELIKSIETANNAEQKLKEFNEASILVKRLRAADEEHQLRKKHAEDAQRAAKEAEVISAKAKDLEANRQKYIDEERQALENNFAKTRNSLTESYIKSEEALAYALGHKKELLEQEGQKLRNEHSAAAHKAELDKIAAEAKAEDLKNNDIKYYQEAYWTQQQAFADAQNRLAEEKIQAEAKLDFIRNNEGQLLDQAAHKLRIGHINAEHDAMQELINAQAKADDIEKNRDQYLDEELQKLKIGHANRANELNLAAIANEAKAKDLANNKDQYILEARLARENAFYAKRNELEEERIKAEEEIAWNASHRKDLLAQEEQKVRLGYLAEYQQLQLDSTTHLTENMTKEQFIALKEQTKAAEDSIARREKASVASEKALATLRGKGTVTEKKALLEAQIKQRAAEKDWSTAGKKFQITDDMSDDEKAEVQKRRENAVKAEMAVNAAMGALANLAQQLNNQTDKIGAKQAPIDTRLQGSKANDSFVGSYWKVLARDMNKIGAVNPYFKQEDFANNIETLVNKGISFDIKQRAFLMTIQEKIANTFDVADGTLLRLIRIQQQDTTAGRLGMESALNSFLNSMYETSEYLSDVASSVRSSLLEMQAFESGDVAAELEFQVQKWMGSLYSVGMSQDAVQSIAQAFGQIASGDVSGLTGNGASNLLIMAANEAGKSIADILQGGLDAKETNDLMQAMVNYLAEIAESSSDSRVVQQQLANVYGVKASDLRAATNLASSIKDVSKKDLTYGGMIGQLEKMANSMLLRTSTGEFLTNIWDNTQYTMATTMANNPILYLLPKVATLLEDYAGGIDLPFMNVMGFGVDLNTSVAQLMNVAAMGGTLLGSLGPMISGLGSAVSGSLMLRNAGIDTKGGKAPVIARGTPAVLQNVSGSGISESGYIGNASGDDIKNATLQDAADSKKKQMVEAKDEETSDDVVIKSQLAVVSIYNLLEEVAHGSQSLRVRVINANGAGGYGGGNIATEQENSTPTTSTNLGTDNGNWVLSF